MRAPARIPNAPVSHDDTGIDRHRFWSRCGCSVSSSTHTVVTMHRRHVIRGLLCLMRRVYRRTQRTYSNIHIPADSADHFLVIFMCVCQIRHQVANTEWLPHRTHSTRRAHARTRAVPQSVYAGGDQSSSHSPRIAILELSRIYCLVRYHLCQ